MRKSTPSRARNQESALHLALTYPPALASCRPTGICAHNELNYCIGAAPDSAAHDTPRTPVVSAARHGDGCHRLTLLQEYKTFNPLAGKGPEAQREQDAALKYTANIQELD
ncbi:hypothetical protein NDU88_000961 [Pleurodeles waltl]|uniref:Uncharacterized protein n=1 Tax=Pleurodeles waltl TaxID=8319 RepID=A0AAV7KRG8_PLEWA|nr:hypothetical protein NDU88_000961 [Pleurodeles waltl]